MSKKVMSDTLAQASADCIISAFPLTTVISEASVELVHSFGGHFFSISALLTVRS